MVRRFRIDYLKDEIIKFLEEDPLRDKISVVEKFGLPYSSVNKRLGQWGIKTIPRKTGPKSETNVDSLKDQIIEYYNSAEEIGIADVVHKFNIAYTTLKHKFKKWCIEIRPHGPFDWQKNPEKLVKAKENVKQTCLKRYGRKIGFPIWYGKKHSKETKEKQSTAQSIILETLGNGKFSRIKTYDLTNINGTPFKVRGTWELKYGQFLNKNNVLWIRKIYIKYTDVNGILKTYTPDFYLPSTNEFVEVKGEYTEVMKEKMKRVLEQNNISLKILFGKDLIKLGINLSK